MKTSDTISTVRLTPATKNAFAKEFLAPKIARHDWPSHTHQSRMQPVATGEAAGAHDGSNLCVVSPPGPAQTADMTAAHAYAYDIETLKACCSSAVTRFASTTPT
jgi:hypothetical protein